jgi:hypothetical protein
MAKHSSLSRRRNKCRTLQVELLENRQLLTGVNLSLAILPPLLRQVLSSAPALSATLHTNLLGAVEIGGGVSYTIASVSNPHLTSEAHARLSGASGPTLAASVDLGSRATGASDPGVGADVGFRATTDLRSIPQIGDLNLHGAGDFRPGADFPAGSGIGVSMRGGIGITTSDSVAAHGAAIVDSPLTTGKSVAFQAAIDAAFSTGGVGQDLPRFPAGRDGDGTNPAGPADPERLGTGEDVGPQPDQSLDLSNQSLQGTDLLTGCAPSETASLERLLEQLLGDLGNLSGDLVGSLARLGLNPWIVLMLAGAAIAGEFARRHLNQSQRTTAVPRPPGLLPGGLL